MDKYYIRQLRDLPIEGVAERLGLHVVRHRSLCPFHDDHHASLTFDRRRNTCRCFACMDRAMGTIDLVMRQLSMNFLDACRWLSEGEPIVRAAARDEPGETATTEKEFDATRYERHFMRPHLGSGAREFLLSERMIDERVARWCRLNSWRDRRGVEWLQIPYFDLEGRLTGVQGRNLVKGALPRFRFPQGSRCSIYNMPILHLLRPGEPLYITEGPSDCWAMLSSGHKAIAVPSATLLDASGIAVIARHVEQLSTPLHMYPDQDEPGERLYQRLRQLLPSIERHDLPPGCKDYSDYYLSVRKEVHHG